MMYTDLFDRVLVEPASADADMQLLVLSGFANANMAHRHLKALSDVGLPASVDLIVGMTGYQGIDVAHHRALYDLATRNPYKSEFRCRYMLPARRVHAKAYLWLRDRTPFKAFVGSANYTMSGFLRSQVEAMAETDPQNVWQFITDMATFAVDCYDDTIAEQVSINDRRQEYAPMTQDKVVLSLLSSRTDQTHEKAGLNWGQRKGRDRNQAYIPVPAQHTEFFPPRGQQFTAYTDDDQSFVFVKAQDGGKALHTTHSNAELGRYIRMRLGLESGEFITRQHLEDYGRTDIDFIKFDEETYEMDFSPPREVEHDQEVNLS